MAEVIPIRPRRSHTNPCPAKVEAPFLGTDAGYLACGGVEGHDGTHYFHVEWGEGDTRWSPDASDEERQR